ncbi:MAG: SH3 domain-containing protein [Chloroflexota bacterium]
MPSSISISRKALFGLMLLVFLQACNMRPGLITEVPTLEETSPSPTEIQVEPTLARTMIAIPTATPIQMTAIPTPSAMVSITAVKGNLFIRRGPDMAFNQIGVLYEGQKVDALARDVLSNWAQINIPGQDGQTGWISLQTKYSSVDGEVSTLPVIKPEIWPEPAYVRNCTFHQMVVQPGEIILPSLLEAPENEVWVYPGVYTVYDLDHPDQPDVAGVQLREGIVIDIQVDGDGDKHKCP